MEWYGDLEIGNERDKFFVFCNGWIAKFFNLTEENLK